MDIRSTIRNLCEIYNESYLDKYVDEYKTFMTSGGKKGMSLKKIELEMYRSEEYISHGNKKRSVIERVYAIAQKIMLKQKEQWLTKHSKQNKRYLDFGCGTGTSLKIISKYFKSSKIWGYDVSKEFIKKIKNTNKLRPLLLFK